MLDHLKYYTGKFLDKVHSKAGFFVTVTLIGGGVGTVAYNDVNPELDTTGGENRWEVKEDLTTDLEQIDSLKRQYDLASAMDNAGLQEFNMIANWGEPDEDLEINTDEIKEELYEKSVEFGVDLYTSNAISETDFQELAKKFNAIDNGWSVPEKDSQVIYADECRLTDVGDNKFDQYKALGEMGDCMSKSNGEGLADIVMSSGISGIFAGFWLMVFLDSSRTVRRMRKWGNEKPKKKTPAPKN